MLELLSVDELLVAQKRSNFIDNKYSYSARTDVLNVCVFLCHCVKNHHCSKEAYQLDQTKIDMK